MFSALGVTAGAAATAAIFVAAEMASTSNSYGAAVVVGGHNSIVRPFTMADSKIVARCAVSAQHKNQRRRNKTSTAASGESMPPIMRAIPTDANESYLNGLPINQVRYENPHRQGALFCRSGTWLEIRGNSHLADDYDEGGDDDSSHYDNNGNDQLETNNRRRNFVRGIKHNSSPYTVLEFIAVAFGLVSVRGVASQNYMCMDSKGELYATPANNYSAECVFMEEMLENYYNLYSSCAHGAKHRPWYVALQRTGITRRGRHTRKKQKSSHFLMINMDYDIISNNFKPTSNGNALFSSYNHAATLIQPELLKPAFSEKSKQRKSGEKSRQSNGKESDSSKSDVSKTKVFLEIPPYKSSGNNHNYDWRKYNDRSYQSQSQFNYQPYHSYHSQQQQQQISQQKSQYEYDNYLHGRPHQGRHHNHLKNSVNKVQNLPSSGAVVLERTPERKNLFYSASPSTENINNPYITMTEAEKFRKDLRRQRRLLREEKRRQLRKEELERLRNAAAVSSGV